MTKVFPRVPRDFSIKDGSKSAVALRSSILDIEFSPDSTMIAIAGGGRIPGCDSSIRIASATDLTELMICNGHVCGIYDLAFDLRTGFLASASEDYSVIIWNLEKRDAIFLVGGDDIVKHRVAFAESKALIAIGESESYDDQSSIYVMDLSTGKTIFTEQLEVEMSIDGMAISGDGSELYFARQPFHNGNDSNVCFRSLLGNDRRWNKFYEATTISALRKLQTQDSLAAAVMVHGEEMIHSGIRILDSNDGTCKAERLAEGIGSDISISPKEDIAVCGNGSGMIEILRLPALSVLRTYEPEEKGYGSICSIQFYPDTKSFLAGNSKGILKKFDC